jgi:hypothetical protein
MVIRKINSTKSGRRSCNCTERNGNHTERNLHGSSQIPPNFGVGQEDGKEWDKRIQLNQEKIEKVLWCFMYFEEKALGEN